MIEYVSVRIISSVTYIINATQNENGWLTAQEALNSSHLFKAFCLSKSERSHWLLELDNKKVEDTTRIKDEIPLLVKPSNISRKIHKPKTNMTN